MSPDPTVEAAAARAEKLFLSFLRPAELQEWRATRAFTITGSDGRRYTIYPGTAYNVLDHESGWNLCAHPVGVPDWDVMIAQKLRLETDALGFRQIANRGPRIEIQPFETRPIQPFETQPLT